MLTGTTCNEPIITWHSISLLPVVEPLYYSFCAIAATSSCKVTKIVHLLSPQPFHIQLLPMGFSGVRDITNIIHAYVYVTPQVTMKIVHAMHRAGEALIHRNNHT